MNKQEIIAFFLNHDDPWYELIQDYDTETGACIIATGIIRDENGINDNFVIQDLIDAVKEIRDG